MVPAQQGLHELVGDAGAVGRRKRALLQNLPTFCGSAWSLVRRRLCGFVVSKVKEVENFLPGHGSVDLLPIHNSGCEPFLGHLITMNGGELD